MPPGRGDLAQAPTAGNPEVLACGQVGRQDYNSRQLFLHKLSCLQNYFRKSRVIGVALYGLRPRLLLVRPIHPLPLEGRGPRCGRTLHLM